MAKRIEVPAFDFGPPRQEEPDEREEPCDHDMVLVQKLEHKWRPDAMETVYKHKCVYCGIVTTDDED